MEKEEKQEQNFEELYYEFQVLDQQLKQLQEQLANFEAQHETIDSIIEGLDQYAELEEGTDILVPLHNGIFIEAKTGKNKNVKINVGSNTVVEKTVDEAKELVSKQKKQLVLAKQDTEFKIQQVSQRLQEIEEALTKQQ